MRATSAAAAAAVLACGASVSASVGWGQASIDGHVHLTNTSLLTYMWANASAGMCPCAPPCLCNWTVADYLSASSTSPPTKFVFVEVNVNATQWFLEAQWVSQVVANGTDGGMVGGIVAQMPPGFGVPGVPASEMNRLLAKLAGLGGLVKGIRAGGVNYSDPVQMQTVVAHAQLLSAHNLSMDINAPLAGGQGVVDGILNLTRALPGTTFVLDHIGNPPVLGTPEEQAAWEASITALAVGSGPNLFVKVGGFLQGFKSGGVFPTIDQVRPWFTKAVDAFGWSRCFYEGNWFFVDWLQPARLDALSAWLSFADQLSAEMGAGPGTPERDMFIRSTAAKAYRVDGV